MKIGIDIDGVLTDLATFHLDYGIKYSYENNLGDIKDPYGYKIDDVINLDISKHRDFWNENADNYTKKKYVREFAPEIMQKLKEEGHEIHIITARNPKFEFSADWTTNWLRDNNICYDKLTFTGEKLDYCKENNIDLMIEDSKNAILELSKIMPVICFDAPYNHNCSGANILRCYSWYDVYIKIKELEEK